MAASDAVARALSGLEGPAGIAISGGGDSTALLLLAQEAGHPLRAATVDHGLRDSSAAEARAVAGLCDARGIPNDILILSLNPGPALQARARDARYAALADWARAQDLAAVLLGHSADDVAETLLMRLADGAGLDGLARMRADFTRGGTRFLRPLLDASRAELRAVVEAAGLTPIEDPSNTDTGFERVRVRRAMAALDLEPAHLARSAAALRDAADALEDRTRAAARAICTADRGDWLIDRAGLAALPRDLARRVLLAGLRWIGGGDHPPRHAEQLELMERIAAGAPATLAGCLLTPEGETLRLAREPAAAAAVPDAAPGTVWDGRWTVEGPDDKARIHALGAAVSQTDWRASGLPRRSLMAAPAAFRDGALVAAPLVAPVPGWSVRCREPFTGRDDRR
ncbi:tRNA lysidine(34) synthetase TilS [Jannaschia ovalis]|uniref:tRNA(Ile)-lysidine synthase n=1 Tax=Jannaschia ovalis TaxID=3038773 RepID=A0ABY8LDI3_9RHOB|nr:tRNA lysidine(34) synthetase TilS [Jannaschia sp. GRR-S6-38]WGH79376.1 tRNA lysidine(34) synthetase TilS [Jannaschia sp. GRR-S6-38]